MYVKTTKYVIAFSLIVFFGLVLFGKPFLKIWIGKEISDISYPLLVIISFVFFFISISSVGYYYYNGLGLSKINMISSFVGAIAYIVSAIILIPLFNLKGAAFSFIFILLPYPVYVYILNKVISFSQIEYIKMLTKSVALLVLTLALNFVSYFVFNEVIIYMCVNILTFLLIVYFIFTLKFIDFKETKKLLARS
jgi:O-antigen/teichoic acid export membrane protein